MALIINDKKEVRIEQLNVEHLKFERLQYQLPYKSPSQPSSEESPLRSEMVDPDLDLAKEVRQLSGDIKELQIKLGILHRIMKNQGEAIREKYNLISNKYFYA